MAIPPSVTKIRTRQGQSEVILESSVDRVNYTLSELTKAALRDCGKFLKKEAKNRVPVRSGTLKKNISTWVRKYGLGETALQIGLYTPKKAREKNIPPAYHQHLVLFGFTHRSGKKVAGNNFLQAAVEENIETIRKIQAQYLSALSDESAVALIDETEGEIDD